MDSISSPSFSMLLEEDVVMSDDEFFATLRQSGRAEAQDSRDHQHEEARVEKAGPTPEHPFYPVPPPAPVWPRVWPSI
jgi:hypothetical protein